MIFDYEKFKQKIEEHSLYFDQLQRFDNYLSHISDEKQFLKDLTNEMENFKKVILEHNDDGKFNFKLKRDGKYFTSIVKFNDDIENVIKKITRLVKKIEKPELKDKSIRIVYGADYEMNFNPEIQIDTDNFNRIDIINEIPYSLRNIGIGKALYKSLINKRGKNGLVLGYLSSNYDSSKDSKFVWDSLRQDDSLYTCIKDFSIISFSNMCSKDTIENVLRKWLRGSENYEIDRDLLIKYPDLDIS